MTIQDAVLKVVDFARTVGHPSQTLVADSVRAVWPDLHFSAEDATALMQAGLMQRANFPVIRRHDKTVMVETPETVDFDSGEPVPVRNTEVTVEHYRVPLLAWEVTCEWLEHTKLHVSGGDLKSIKDITLREWQTRQKNTAVIQVGAENFNNVHAHVINKLVVFGKKTIGELAPGEQKKIAQVFFKMYKQNIHPVLK